MSNVKFYSFNLATLDETDITASSEDSFFPGTNVKDPRTTKEWRSASGVSSANLIFDFKTSEPVDSILVKGNHIDGFGFTSMTIEANITSDFSSPAFSTTLTPNFGFNFGLKTLGSTETYRFWRISVSGGGNFVSLSNIFIGRFVQMSANNIDYGWTNSDNDLARVRRNRFGQAFIDKTTIQKNLSGLTLNVMNKTEVDQLFEVYNEVSTTDPLWIVIDESETIINDFERFAGTFYLTSQPRVTNSAFSLYDAQLNLREVV